MEQHIFGGTIIKGHCNDILCCVNGADTIWRYNKAGLYNDILSCVNGADCVWRYKNNETR